MDIEKNSSIAGQTISFIPETPLKKNDVLFAGALAVVVTLFALQFSFAYGRLLIPLAYDDLSYFIDAIERVRMLYMNGVGAVVRDYIHHPPHAPLSAGLASLGFLLFGTQNWAPYAANCLLLFILLLFVSRLTSDLPALHRALILLFVCTVPVSIMAVIEFRPDFGAALFTSMGIIWTLGRPIHSADRRHLLASGALFGIALLAKPSIFPFTVFIWGCSIAAGILCEMWTNRSFRIPAGTVRNGLLNIAAGATVSLVYFAFAFREIVEYVRTVVFSSKSDLWVLHGGIGEQLRFYIFGGSGRQFLGGHAWLLLGGITLCSAVVFATARKNFSIRWLALIVLLGLTYAFPTANRVKSQFFGMTFQTLLPLCGVLSLRYAVARLGGKGLPTVARLAVPVAVFVGGALLMMPLFPFWGARGTAAIEEEWHLWQINTELLHLLEKYSDGKETRIFLTAAGAVNSGTLQWAAAKETGLRQFISTSDLGWDSDLRLYRERIANSDLVVAAEPGVLGVWQHLPSVKCISETFRMVAESPDFMEVGRVPDGAGKNYRVYKRIAAFAFLGWKDAGGFLPSESPYFLPPRPPLARSAVRWACGPESRLQLDGVKAGHLKLNISCRADAGQVMTIRYGGVALKKALFSDSNRFIDIAVEFDAKNGDDLLHFEFTKWESKPQSRPLAAVFKRLQILDGGTAR